MDKRELDRYWQLVCVNFGLLNEHEQCERKRLCDAVRACYGFEFENDLWRAAYPYQIAETERRRRARANHPDQI